jgi:uncharacterized membrane protein
MGTSHRERILDLVFLIGVAVKGLDGLIELLGGAVLLLAGRAQVLGMTRRMFAHELAEDPKDPLATLVLHGVAHLGAGDARFLAAYLLVHGLVKAAVVVALLVGNRRVYPWAIAVLLLFLVYQVYELVTAPSAGVVLLTALDVFVILLTWREWRHGRTLHETWHGTVAWALRRGDAAADA